MYVNWGLTDEDELVIEEGRRDREARAIDFDHTHILGRTVEEIAKDKAGIIKPGSLCILGPQTHPIVETIIND